MRLPCQPSPSTRMAVPLRNRAVSALPGSRLPLKPWPGQPGFAVQREARQVHSLRSGVQFQAHRVVAQLVTRLSGSREQGGCGGTQKHAAGKRRKGGEFRVSHILT